MRFPTRCSKTSGEVYVRVHVGVFDLKLLILQHLLLTKTIEDSIRFKTELRRNLPNE